MAGRDEERLAAHVQILLSTVGVAVLAWLLTADPLVSTASAWTLYWALVALASAGYYGS